jgi:hypothetical protein
MALSSIQHPASSDSATAAAEAEAADAAAASHPAGALVASRVDETAPAVALLAGSSEALTEAAGELLQLCS